MGSLNLIDELMHLFNKELKTERNIIAQNAELVVENQLYESYKSVVALGLELEKYSWPNLLDVKSLINELIFVPTLNMKIDYTDSFFGGWRIATITGIHSQDNDNEYLIDLTMDRMKSGSNHNMVRFRKNSSWDRLSIMIAKLNVHTLLHYYLFNPIASICKDNIYHWSGDCQNCGKRCCECMLIQVGDSYRCILCQNKIKYHLMYDALKNSVADILYDDIIKFIVEYSFGISVSCSNIKCTNLNEITFNDDMQFDRNKDIDNNDIYKYEVKSVNLFKNKNNFLHSIEWINGKGYRIFCNQCGKLQNYQQLDYCDVQNCNNKDFESICADHPFVEIVTCCYNQCNDKIYLENETVYGHPKIPMDICGRSLHCVTINHLNKELKPARTQTINGIESQIYCGKCTFVHRSHRSSRT